MPTYQQNLDVSHGNTTMAYRLGDAAAFTNYTKRVAQITNAAGMKDVKYHDMRNSGATWGNHVAKAFELADTRLASTRVGISSLSDQQYRSK